MGNKKKFHGSLNVLLVLLFIMVLGGSSISFASDTSFKNLTGDDYSAIFNYIADNFNSWNLGNFSGGSYATNIRNLANNSSKMSSLAQQISAIADTDASIYNVVFAVCDVNYDLYLRIYYNNNQIGNKFPYLKTWQTYDGSLYTNKIQYIDDNGNSVSYNFIPIKIDYTNGNVILQSQVNSNGSNSTLVRSGAGNFDIGNGVYFANFPCFFGIRQKNIAPYTNYNPTVYSKYSSESFYIWRELKNSVEIVSMEYIEPTPEPEEPSGETGTTGQITNQSGEVTGNIDLSGIENSLNNIENKIPTSGDIGNILSGETGKIIGTLTDNPDLSNTHITSGDITDALDFDFATDPYANFWLELTNGLKNALLGTKRTIDVTFQSRTWTIDLDDFAVLPAWLVIIITPFSTVFFVWILVRWWKVIFDKITSGNVDSILKENSEERDFKFVLGGINI